MADPRNLILRSIVPLGAVPDRLRAAVGRELAARGRSWDEVTFAGTALLPVGHWPQLEPRADEAWVFALSTREVEVGGAIHADGGDAFAVSVPRMPDGFIPSVGYSALVYQSLAGDSSWTGPRGSDVGDELERDRARSSMDERR